MLRFRNPSVQYSTQVQVMRVLYESLGRQASFSLEDMAAVIARSRLMTAYGYAGDAALNLSHTSRSSINSVQMNAKMYAEVFRMLGWMTPYGRSSYPLVFTYIGLHVGSCTGSCSRLYEQCALGINNPTEISDRVRYSERVRIIKCILRAMIDLGGVMYKHELCIGPMSIADDDNDDTYHSMIVQIESLRGNIDNLKSAFANLATELGVSEVTVDNCTRLPVAILMNCGYAETCTTSALYGQSQRCLRITPHGMETYEELRRMKDLRLEEFNRYDADEQASLIRIGVYSMLQRSGYDISSVEGQLSDDNERCSAILGHRDLLFSPYQTIRRQAIEEALGIRMGCGDDREHATGVPDPALSERETVSETQVWSLDVSAGPAAELLSEPADIAFLTMVEGLHAAGESSHAIVDELFELNATARRATFYPLIATLFRVMGFRCQPSRPGDNGARWDAIIDDPRRSVPIEIKSPSEEQYLSVKAIRQALENKIVLLSRRTYITDAATTTLAVGYYMPNERAEVARLIQDVRLTYGYRIGVIDLKTLLSAAVSTLIEHRGLDRERLYLLEGLVTISA